MTNKELKEKELNPIKNDVKLTPATFKPYLLGITRASLIQRVLYLQLHSRKQQEF